VPLGAGIRVDSHIQPGAAVPPYYDSMIAKLIVHAADRGKALDLMGRALAKLRISGVPTTVPLHRDLVADPTFRAEPPTTRWLQEDFLPTWQPGA
jgi:acetyl-CoA carboxylase biotin carboxylase subunit